VDFINIPELSHIGMNYLWWHCNFSLAT